MDDLIRLCAVAVTAVLLHQLLKRDVPSLALAVILAGAAVILLLVLPAVERGLGFFSDLAEMANISSGTLQALLKTVAVAVLTRLTADVCRDASGAALASAVEIGGACIGFYLALPILSAALEMLTSLL